MKANTNIKSFAVPALVTGMTVLLIAGMGMTGCGKKATTNPDISAANFRADPSKMTPAEKQKLDEMMRSGGRPAAK